MARTYALLFLSESLLQTLGAILLPDYLLGEPADRVEELLRRLDRPSMGVWWGLVREICRVLSRRQTPPPFLAEAGPWLFPALHRSSDAYRCVEEQLLPLRNQFGAHPAAKVVSTAAFEQHACVAEAAVASLLDSLWWLGRYRLFHLATSPRPTRRRSFKAEVHFLVGELGTQESREWGHALVLLDECVYLAHPTGARLLSLDPLIRVLAGGKHGEQGCFVVGCIPGLDRVVLHEPLSGASVKGVYFPHLDEHLLFQQWLERRSELELMLDSAEWASQFENPEATALTAGELLGDRFELRRPLGKGGMAEVWAVWDRDQEREVALKILHRDLAKDASLLRRFELEARRMRELSGNPRILRCQQPVLVSGFQAIPMDLMPGGTVQGRIDDPSRPALELVLRWAVQALEALEALHARGIVHRDIKPSNLLLDDRDDMVLADLGIALKEGDARLTRAGEQIGTTRYMSVEQVRGYEVGPPSDIFSLALVLHEAMLGPQTRHTSPGRKVPGELGEILRKMGSPDPEDRPTASEALAFLRETMAVRRAGEPSGCSEEADPAAKVAPPTPDARDQTPPPAAPAGLVLAAVHGTAVRIAAPEIGRPPPTRGTDRRGQPRAGALPVSSPPAAAPAPPIVLPPPPVPPPPVEDIRARVEAVGRVFLDRPPACTAFEPGEPVRFGTAITCSSEVQRFENIACGMAVFDRDSGERVWKVPSTFSVARHPSGRFRFHFELRELLRGNYRARVAFAIRESGQEPVTADVEFEVQG